MASNSAFAQGTTESDTAAGEEAQSTGDPLELISTIQSLLNQAVVEYGNQNFTGAAELAQIAYLDNYEYLEAPLGQLDPALMEATEIMIREDMQNSNSKSKEQEYLLANCNNWSIPLMVI